MKNHILSQRLFLLAAAAACCATLQAASVIDEPFAQTAGAINGKAASTTGLTGNWTLTAGTVNVVNPDTITHGALANTGGQVDVINAGNSAARVTTSSDLATAGLLNDGATLWFSMVYQKTADGGSNEHGGFAFGSSHLVAGSSGTNLNASGNAFGFVARGTAIRVAKWTGTTALSSATAGLSAFSLNGYSVPTLIVGKIEWGATSGDNDKLTLYKGNPNLTLGAGTELSVTGFDQSNFNIISFAQRNSNGTYTFDEIRFGASQADVLPADTVPPTLLSITDDKAGGPIGEDVAAVTYTLSFDKHMDIASITAADFDNAGTATATVGTVTQVSPTVITVQLLPTSTGTLQLRIPATSVLKSLAQVDLDTTVDILDDTTITINAGTTPANTPTSNRWWDGTTISGITNGVSGGGTATWDNGTTTNWDRGAGFEASVAWDNSSNLNAILGGAANAAYTATLSETINLKDLTFDTTGTTGARYTISGGTLNFASGAVIRATNNQYDQTITSAITGSPAVETKDFGAGNTYLGLKFAPASGTQALGAILNPNNTGTTDKAGVTFAGSTTGNTIASINYAGTDQYADTVFQSGGWTVNGNVTTGTIRFNGGVTAINGIATGMYNGFVYTAGTLTGTASLRRNDRRGNHDFLSGFKVAPGNGVGTITVLDGTTQTPTSVQQFTIFRAGVIYEWEVGPSSQDTVHIAAGKMQLDGFTLKILDAGGTPANGAVQLPVFTYAAGVTIRTLSLGSVVFDTADLVGKGWTIGTLALTDDGAGTIYLTGLSKTSGTTYTVTYDGNGNTGGSVPVDGATYATGATVTVSGNTGSLVKTGFVFTGWNSLADGLGTHYGATFTMGTANTTLFAEWKTPYNIWAAANGATGGSGADTPDGDGLSNLLEYAFGTDPTVSFNGPIVYANGGAVTTPGQPVLLQDTGIYYAVFGRRTDYVAAGLTYTVQFSAGLDLWESSATVPTVLTDGSGTVQAARVQFPNSVMTPSGPKKPTFFRVQVSN